MNCVAQSHLCRSVTSASHRRSYATLINNSNTKSSTSRYSVRSSVPTTPIFRAPSEDHRLHSIITKAGNAQASSGSKNYIAGYHDIWMVIDDSSSMRPIWSEAQEGVEALLVEAIKRDDDGVMVSFLNSDEVYCVSTVKEVIHVFDKITPLGTTPTAEALRRVTNPYWDGFNPRAPKKPLSIVIVTDGCPDDPKAVEKVVADSARKMQDMALAKGHMGFTFVGIGIPKGSKAYKHLMDLDVAIPAKYHVPDIADCAALDEDDGSPLKLRLLKCLFGGVNSELDAMNDE